MKFLSNAHTHTTYCDGQSTAESMIEAAKGLGFVSLGFSGHGYQGFDDDFSMPAQRQEDYTRHLRTIQSAMLARKEAPRLWVGLEEDTLTPPAIQASNRRELDYIISSTHYLTRDFEGDAVAVDGDPELLKRYVSSRFEGDGLAMAKAYFQLHVTGLLASKPNIIGHFDLVRKYASSYGFFDEASVTYRRFALSALEAAYPCGGVLELNTGAMARGSMTSPYPTRELLAAWRDMGGQVTITSDCHDAGKLDYAFDLAVKTLISLGYAKVLRLGRGDELWEETPLSVTRC